MSSILRALKQAEKASAGQDDKQDPSGRSHVLLRPNAPQPRRYARGLVWFFFFMIVIAGTGIAIYFKFFFHEKNLQQAPLNPVSSPAPESSPAGMKDKIHKEETPSGTADILSGQQDDSKRSLTTSSELPKSTPKISDPLTADSKTAVQSTPAEPSMSVPRISDTLTAGSRDAVQSEPAAEPVTVQKKTSVLKESAVTSSGKNIQKERPALSRKKLDTGLGDGKIGDAQALESIPEEPEDSIVSKEEEAGVNFETQEIPRLEESPFKIQAISWSEEANRRIAVIDDRVLIEGDRVQGYRLITIEKDSVILRYEGKNYRLLFSYR